MKHLLTISILLICFGRGLMTNQFIVKSGMNCGMIYKFYQLCGLSPREFSSGSSIRARARICNKGGKTLRNILYMCSLNAIKTNQACKQLYERVGARGKNKKLALIAVCNKLLKQVFGVIKNQTLFNNTYLKN